MRKFQFIFVFSLILITPGCKSNNLLSQPEAQPFEETEVRIINPSDGVELAGTLTIPIQPGIHPAVLLIPGSGPHNRNEEILGHKPFLVLADHLARNGTAVLRLDKRGCGESGGTYQPFDIENFILDAKSGVEFLKNHEQVDHSRIGVLGHSQGGLIAPMLAIESIDISLVILLAAPGKWGPDFFCSQNIAIARAAGYGDAEIRSIKELYKRLTPIITKGRITASEKSEGEQILENIWDFMDEASRIILGNTDAVSFLSFIRLENIRSFMDYDPTLAIGQVKCPLLAICGSRDVQVPARESLAALKSALESSGHSEFTVMELPGLNHLLQECETGLVSEYPKIEESISVSALAAISDWLTYNVTEKNAG